MLSYQHHYHVGNHADVLKHWVLLACLKYLQNKDKPFEYIDTHAGAGCYALDGEMTQKKQEYKSGISKLLGSDLPALQDYLSVIQTFLDKNQYPGSPQIVQSHLRPKDRSWLFEMHPKTYQELTHYLGKSRATRIEKSDGFKGLAGLLPVTSRRALILVDPSYEIKTDYQTVITAMQHGIGKMANSVFLIWYPVVDRLRIDQMEKSLKNSELSNVWQFEMSIDDDEQPGMTGSGMLVCNPPWTLPTTAKTLLPELSSQLSVDGKARFKCQCLCPE